MLILKGKIKNIYHLKTGKKITIFCKPSDLEMINLNQMAKKEGYFAFSADEIKAETEEVMKDLKIGINDQGKSMSQIMRGKLWTYWNDHYPGNLAFEDFYMATYRNLFKELENKMK